MPSYYTNLHYLQCNHSLSLLALIRRARPLLGHAVLLLVVVRLELPLQRVTHSRRRGRERGCVASAECSPHHPAGDGDRSVYRSASLQRGQGRWRRGKGRGRGCSWCLLPSRLRRSSNSRSPRGRRGCIRSRGAHRMLPRVAQWGLRCRRYCRSTRWDLRCGLLRLASSTVGPLHLREKLLQYAQYKHKYIC